MKYFYKLNDDLITFKSKHVKSFTPTIKKLLKRNDVDIFKHLEGLGFETKLCQICKSEYNHNFDLEFNISESNVVSISNVKWGKSSYNYEKYNKNYCYGINRKCDGLKMNPNSVDFISKTLKLSASDALKYIHNNNSSPFYLENHNNIEEYSKSQSRGLSYFLKKYNNSGKSKYYKIIDKIKHSNSKIGYIEKYGIVDGPNLWDNISKSKAITLANLQSKHGNIKGKDKYENWIRTCSKTNYYYIDKYGIDEGLKRINHRRLKKAETLYINKGIITIPTELRFEYMIYSQLVWDASKYNLLIYGRDKFININKSLSLDHMVSIKSGFVNNLHPDIVGHIENLRYISKSENCKKKDVLII